MTWHPAPLDLVREADRERWTPERPAPTLVGYLVVWADLAEGRRWTKRKLSKHLGWTEWRAREVLSRVKSEQADWTSETLDVEPAEEASPGNDPPTGVIPGGSGDVPPIARARARERLTSTSTSRVSTSTSAVWESVNALRAEHGLTRALKLTKGRRVTLEARAREHGAEAVVEVWRWALTSESKRAAYLREGGYVRPETLHRASKFASYSDLAAEDAARATPTSGGDALDTFLDT